MWQFNGEFGLCNYRCPYCYYGEGVLSKHCFKGPIELWKQALKKSFGENRTIIFYLSFGEPTIGRGFRDVLNMVASEPKWRLHITSNLSLPLAWWKKLVKRKIVGEHKLFINASFHPTETTLKEFIPKLLLLREHYIECPVVLVMWPPIIKRFKEIFKALDEHNFLIHLRRFEGWYNGKWYPRAYTEEERRLIVRFMDDASIKYTLNYQNHKAKLSFCGVYYILLDENGDVWESPDSRGRCLGSIFRGDVKLYNAPHPYSGSGCASVQGIAALLELGYGELEPNFVISYSKKGGVFHTQSGKVHYKNRYVGFGNKTVRKGYGFPTGLKKVKLVLLSNLIDPMYARLYSYRKIPAISKLLKFASFMYTYPPGHLTFEYFRSYMDGVKTGGYTPKIFQNPKISTKLRELIGAY